MNILEEYIKTPPSPQNALDLFKNEWTSLLPPGYEGLRAGNIPLFQDGRIVWAESVLGPFQNKSFIELGPLEGGHSYMLENAGAKSVLAIEANTRAYLKCLITKEILDLKKTKFLLGDFQEFLNDVDLKFDICLASGVLYHMINPVELLEAISKSSNALILWTQYYDPDPINSSEILSKKFSDKEIRNHNGIEYTLTKYHYHNALDWSGFCGGSNEHSYWMKKEDIFQFLDLFGFSNIVIGSDDSNHPNGPCILLTASK